MKSTVRFQEKKRRQQRIFLLAFFLIFFFFIASTLFGDSGILAGMRVKQEYRALVAEKERILIENQQLREDIKAVKTSRRRIEAIGRREFGFGRPGEIIFYFPPDQEDPIQEIAVPFSEPTAP